MCHSNRRRRKPRVLHCRLRKNPHEAGLKNPLHSNGTNIEGDWDAVMQAVKECHQKLHEMGAPRIATTIHIGTRVDREQTLEDKIRSVEEKMHSAHAGL